MGQYALMQLQFTNLNIKIENKYPGSRASTRQFVPAIKAGAWNLLRQTLVNPFFYLALPLHLNWVSDTPEEIILISSFV